MKKVMLFLALLALLVSPVFGTTPYDKTEGCVHYFGSIALANDTLWHPGLGTNNSYPNPWGLSLDSYKHLIYELDWLTTDSTHPDMVCSLYVDLYTGYIGGSKDSMSVVIPFDSIPGGLSVSAATTAKKWVPLLDSSGVYWFQRYVWWRIRSVTTQGTDTTFTGAPDTDGDLWSAAGDSLLDWNSQAADGYFWNMLNETEHDSFIYVTGKDSLLAVAMNTMSAGTDPGEIDSVVFSVCYWESLTVIAKDTFRVGIVFGDSSQHHFDSLDIGTGGSGVLWAAALAADGGAAIRDTLTYTFTTDPHGNAWTRTTLDSCIVILDPVHVDTTSDGTAGIFCVARLWSSTYHARSKLEPDVDYRLTIWRRE